MTTPPVLSKVHTFAQDLERVRGSRGDAPGTKLPVATNVSTQPTAADTTTAPGGGVQNAPIKLTADTARDASYPATIITDKKRRTLNLTEEVSTAVGDWWNEKVKSLTGGNKPTYSVPAVERRKGVVHAATTQTGRVATSDHREIVAKLKQETNRSTPIATSTVPATSLPTSAPIELGIPKSTVPQIGYDDTPEVTALPSLVVPTPIIETPVVTPPTSSLRRIPEATEIEKPTSTITVTEVVRKAPRIEPVIPVLEEVLEDSSEDEFELQSTEDDTLAEVASPSTPMTDLEPLPVTPVSFPKISPIVPTAPAVAAGTAPYQRENAFSLLAEVPRPSLPTTSSAVKENIANRMEQRVPVAAPATNRFGGLIRLAPYLAGGLFIVITVGGIAYFMMAGTSTPPETVLTTDLPIGGEGTALPDQTYRPEAVTAQLDAPNKASLYAAVENTAGLGDGLFIVTPLAHDTAFPLGTREILGLINRQLSPDFVGNINNIQLGMYRDEPVILLSISDENSARGGMFRWETTMSQDLSPWFGLGLRMTNTNNVTSFTDGESAGRDVRILTDDIGTERITYGFINQSILLVTTNTAAFLNIADSYRGY